MAISSTRREYYVQLVDVRTKRPVADSTGSYQVYTAGSAARATITDAAGTTLTQSVNGSGAVTYVSRSTVNGALRFFTPVSVSSVDISILTAGGRAYFLKGITSSQHRVDVDPDRSEYALVCAIDDKGSSTTIRALGFQLRKGMAIKDIYVKVQTSFAGAATGNNKINFGRSGAASGLISKINLTATGFKQPIVLSSTGTVVAGQQWGSDLRTMKTGNATNFGWIARKNYFAATGVASNNLVMKRNNALTATFTTRTGKGYVYYVYRLVPTEASQQPGSSE